MHALNNVGSAGVYMGDLAGRAKLERSLELALTHGMHEHAARAYVNLTDLALTAHDYDHARQLIADGIAYMRNLDLNSWTMHPLSERARVHLELGLWREAVDDASAVRARGTSGYYVARCRRRAWLRAHAAGRSKRRAAARRGARAGVGGGRDPVHRADGSRPRRGGLARGRQRADARRDRRCL